MTLHISKALSVSCSALPSQLAAQENLSNSPKSFVYERAVPSVRWPQWYHDQKNAELPLSQHNKQEQIEGEDPYIRLARMVNVPLKAEEEEHDDDGNPEKSAFQSERDIVPVSQPQEWSPGTLSKGSDYLLLMGKKKRGKMSRLALLRATDWRERVQRLSEAVCALQENEFVADLLNKWPEQLNATDYCFVVKQIGYTHWPRALELFECLNVKHWYTPNNRMLSAILGVLARSNQVNLAEEIFQRVEPELGDCVQVFNAMLSVHARHGNWERMQTLLKIMLEKGCERDLVTYNTLISGRAKAGLRPGMAMELLREIWHAGLRPDTVTYNTLISVSSLNKCYEDAVMIYEEMKDQRCQEDIWTYNSMISVYGRCGLDKSAEEVYRNLKEKGFVPDAITYNSILYAYARNGRLEDVDQIRKQMKAAGCNEDEITYNTLIAMYGKMNLHEKALAVYDQMKVGRKRPDAVTYVVLIDGLGKAGLLQKAECVFKEMVEANVKPSLNVFCAMICAYSKAGMYQVAANTYQDMLNAGIRLDGLGYTLMLDVFLNANEPRKALSIYESMMPRHKPSLVQCGLMLQLFKRDGMNTELEELSEQMQQFGFDQLGLCSSFAKVGLCDAAEKTFRTAVSQGQSIDSGTIDLLLNAYTKALRISDAQSLVNSVSFPGLERFREQLIVTLANLEKFAEAKVELEDLLVSGHIVSVHVFRALIVAYELAGMNDEALQMLQKMQDLGLSPDEVCCKSAILAYCRSGKPDLGHLLLRHLMTELAGVKDSILHLAIVKAYINMQQWDKAALAFGELKESGFPVLQKDYQSLLLAYAQHGQSYQVQYLLRQMAAQGFTPSPSSANVTLEALVVMGRLVEVNETYQTFQELGVTLDMRSHVAMLNAFAKTADVEKAKKVYQDMRNTGYVLHVEVFNVLIGMFSKAGWVEDAECIMKDMQDSGFQPNVFCYNAMLSVYGKAKSFKKAAQVFQGMQMVGCAPDTVTYNTLIHLYSRCLHTQEAYALLQQMKQAGCVPTLSSYTLLITAYGQIQMWEAAASLFKDMQRSGIEIDRATYHLMIDIYRRAGRPEIIQDLVTQMKERGLETNITTMNMLMDSYGKGGQTEGAEVVFEGMIGAGVDVNVIQYTSLIDAYLKEGDYDAAISKLKKMESEGIESNYITWTCVIGAASKCKTRDQALMLLRALSDIGFTLPLQLLTGKGSSMLLDLEALLVTLLAYGPGAGSGILNVLQDLLWAFHKRATASKVYNLAVGNNIYDRSFTRVQEGDWGADLCKLSPGAALVALTLWLIRMQEAALQGSPWPSRSVLLVIGSSKRANPVSLSRTVKSHLWEMGAPFLSSKTREGALIAKGYSVQLWLKDSPRCLDLELKDRPGLPERNSMELYEGAWMDRGMVPVFKQIESTMGTSLRPKKFMRLATMHDEKRADVMVTDLKGRAEKLEKDRIRKQRAKAKSSLPVRNSSS